MDYKKKIKVLQVNKLYYPQTGGIEQTVREISEGLNDKVDIKVLVCQSKGKTRIETLNDVDITRAGSFGSLFSMPVSVSFFWHFYKLSKKSNIIHFHMPFPLGDIACLLSQYKGKVVVWWHSDIVRQDKFMLFYKPLMDRFLKRADVIIVGNQGIIDGSKYLGKYRKKCVVIPFGVNENVERIADTYYSTKAFSIKKEKVVNFLFIGRLVYYKGCDILIKAFTKVNGAKLIMVGDGKLKNKLKNIIESENMTDIVTIISDIDTLELTEYIKNCDVLVLPSVARSEAFGLVQIEAMAFGKPVINTNLASGVPYVSIHGQTGLTVEPNNVDMLAKAINWMVTNTEERLHMGRNARERFNNNYRVSIMLDKLYQLYNTIIDSE